MKVIGWNGDEWEIVWGIISSDPTEVVKKKKRINLLYSFSPYRFFSSLSFYRLSAFHHNQADLKRFMHMRQPLRNYFGSDLLNTIEDMFSLFGGNLHGGVIRGRWCLKLVFG